MAAEYLDGDRIFGLHDDIRHVIVADSMGNVIRIFSRAKRNGRLMSRDSFQA